MVTSAHGRLCGFDKVSGTQLDFGKGEWSPPGTPDFTIQGGGFFAVKLKMVWADGLAYTRAGNFAYANRNWSWRTPTVAVWYRPSRF